MTFTVRKAVIWESFSFVNIKFYFIIRWGNNNGQGRLNTWQAANKLKIPSKVTVISLLKSNGPSLDWVLVSLQFHVNVTASHNLAYNAAVMHEADKALTSIRVVNYKVSENTWHTV
jgi:hypothetical protein